eukprot:m.54705 g.54705  ORF g.54705 m.54705 type:complete len:497 (+) comp34397_c0_seq3:40-1530(+)
MSVISDDPTSPSHLNAANLASLGLGRGVDGTRPSALLDVVVYPHFSVIDRLTTYRGFSAFSYETSSNAALQKSLTANVSASSAPVKVEFSVSAQRKEETRVKKTAKGQQIVSNTIRFRLRVIRTGHDDRNDDDEGEDEEAIDSKKSIPISNLEKALLRESDVVDDDAAFRVISDQFGGVTHFVSSVNLGAKIYQERRTQTKKTTKSVKATMKASGPVPVSASGSASQASSAESTSSSSKSKTIAHPDVELKGAATVIEPGKEMLISYELSPVSALVRDPRWRDAVVRACQRYVVGTVVSKLPLISTGGPFFLKVGAYFLRVDEARSRLTTTLEKNDASDFYLDICDPADDDGLLGSDSDDDDAADPIANPQAGFQIRYAPTATSKSGQHLYVTANSDSRDVVLSPGIADVSQGKFYLEEPGSRKAAPLADWTKAAMLVYRKTWFRKRRQYILFTPDRDGTHSTKAVLGYELADILTFPGPPVPLCQFQVVNANRDA